MKFNYGYERWLFEQKQEKQHREYLAAGMSEADVQKMYEFDLEYFRLLRCEALHAVNPQEMMGFDPETGDYHYMDMDELPASELRPTYPDAMSDWFEDIENEDMLQEIMAFPPDYVQIINLLIQGKTHEQISETLGVCRTSITNKVARMKKSLGIFLLT